MKSQRESNKEIVKILESSFLDFQLVIFRSGLTTFTFAKRWVDRLSGEYGELGPPCGIYDSPEVAEEEARLRNDQVDWLEIANK